MSQHPADRPDRPRRLEGVSGQPPPAAPPAEPGVGRASLRRALPSYRLLLHGHPALDLMFIVRTIMEITRFDRAEATHKMWQAHHSGRSQLLVTYRERGELYVEQFRERGLTVTLEPA